MFSKGLDFEKSLQLYRALSSRIHVSFGIGTRLACDRIGVEPMHIVIKLSARNGQPVARISDTPARAGVEDDFVSHPKHVLRV